INVQLPLVVAGIADTHGRRTGKALKMRELLLAWDSFSIDIVVDSQFRTCETSGMEEPADEGFSILVITKPKKRAGSESRIAQPTIPIVPIQISADPFRKRRGRSGNQGPRWCKR